MDNTPVVVVAVPWVDTDHPILAPALLKSILSCNNIESYAIDLNAEVRQLIKNHPHEDALLKFFLTEQLDRAAKDSAKQIIDFMVDRILASNPQWVALSLFSYLSQIITRWLCQRIRQRAPKARIVIGGPGAFVTLRAGDDYAKSLKRQNLIDHYVSGDAEVSIVRLLLGDTNYAGIDSTSWQQMPDLNDSPLPDFDDYDWSLYKHRRISLVGSRGCVRDCTFCDIHEHWSKFQWKTGNKLFSEIKHLKSKYGLNVFHFADSLVNGNQKEHKNLLVQLANYNSTQSPENRVAWSGNFIIRPKGQMKEHDWQLTARSGAAVLSVGVESFVEHIRYHIRKKFSNDDLRFALDMAAKYNIKIILLMIVGYVTETQEDFDQQLRWVEDHKQYANNPVWSVHIGSGLGILPGTWLDRNKESLGITINNPDVLQDWVSTKTATTPQIRMEWHSMMKQKLEDCGFNAEFNKDNHMLIESYLNAKH